MWLLEKLRRSLWRKSLSPQSPSLLHPCDPPPLTMLSAARVPQSLEQQEPCSPRLFCRNLQKSANRHIIQIETDEPSGSADKASVEANTNADPPVTDCNVSARSPSLPTLPELTEALPGGTYWPWLTPTPPLLSGGESDTCPQQSRPFNPSPVLALPLSYAPSPRRRKPRCLCAKRPGASPSPLMNAAQQTTAPTCSAAARAASLPPADARAGGLRSAPQHLPQREHTVNLHKGTLRLSTTDDPEAGLAEGARARGRGPVRQADGS
ncbi:C2 calcium-dependent domain-containing protein 4C-like protein [Lates japonicus]|uniref:C2 calcium-dependent domain-containing protein 4C-like protein n=1 Tax=Lates japonicus TaxID=270547 RepID=A0AAD3MFB4_LATJO|nr:C2 calcium-dependent domain-containing protein 4C-like protein [Lates japonicus]